VIGDALPSLRVNADYGDIGLSPSDARATFSVSGAVTIPIFQGGRIKGRLLEADANLASRRAEAEDLKAGIYYEVRGAILDLEATSQQLTVAGKARDLAAQQLTQARDRFAAGVASNSKSCRRRTPWPSRRNSSSPRSTGRALARARSAAASIDRRPAASTDRRVAVMSFLQRRVSADRRVVLLLVAGAAVWFWATSGRESTDDAQVDARVTQIAARVAGHGRQGRDRRQRARRGRDRPHRARIRATIRSPSTRRARSSPTRRPRRWPRRATCRSARPPPRAT
jgi:hypothetical protein